MPGDFIRTFAKFFTNLTDDQRYELELALHHAQNSKEITNLEASVKLLKRKVDQRLPIPQPTARIVVRGAVIEWPNLPDQRIIFYEVDVSTDTNFANFDTFPTFGTLTILDGLTQTKFVRVRGVRRDGTTTPYSDTVTVIPNLFAINSHQSETFYIYITGTDPNVILGGAGTNLDYLPINSNGNSMVWGFISTYGDPAVGMFGIDQIYADVVVKKVDSDGFLIDEKIEWRVTIGEFFNSHEIGPFIVNHPALNSSVQIRLEVTDKTTLADGTARSGNRTQVQWAHLNAIEMGI